MMKSKKDKAWEKINIKPYQKEKLLAMADGEGRYLYKMIDILMESYENNKRCDIIKKS